MLDAVVIGVLDLSDVGLVVFQGTVPSVVGIAKFLPVLEAVGFDPERQRLVANQSFKGFVGQLAPADIEGRLGRPIDFKIPFQRRLVAAMNAGRPYILSASRRYGFGAAVSEMCDHLAAGAAATTTAAPAAVATEDAGVDVRDDVLGEEVR